MRRNKHDYDLIVIGSGASGSAAALVASEHGKRVAIIESDEFGGYSSHSGDVPRRALLEASRVYEATKEGLIYGIRGGGVGYNYPSINQFRESVMIASGVRETQKYFEDRSIDTYKGIAHFVSPNEVTVNRRHLSAHYFLIASGSQPVVPTTINGLDTAKYLTPSSALDLLKPPKSVFIIGGGKTGVEFATLFSTFGSKVLIAEIAPRLLPNEDVEVSEQLRRKLGTDKGVEILTSTRVTNVTKEGLLHKITYLRGDVEHIAKVEHILLAAGTTPNVDLGLENAEVDYSPLGIAVSDTLQTSVKHIYGAGSVIGAFHSTTSAIYEARVAAHNIFSRDKVSVNYTSIPHVVYASVPVARVGVNEQEALRKDIAIENHYVKLDSLAATLTAPGDDYFIKLVTDRKGILIGGTLVCPGAPEVIHTLALAIQGKMLVSALAQGIYSFGSWSEALQIGASQFKG